MTLNENVRKFIQKESLLSSDVHLLLAVSGGLDSMTLLHLLYSYGSKLAVAHVNYRLREASDEEERLVKYQSLMKNATCHTYRVTDEEREDLKSGNLQSKAREIRYRFFDEVRAEHGYTHLVMAHHLDDQIEGFFLRLLRGSGLDGLSVMKESSDGEVVRPLLAISKEELLDFAHENDISYMDDATNFESEYDRNFIRNEVLPVIAKRFPQYRKSIGTSIDNLKDTNLLLNNMMVSAVVQYSEQHPDGMDVIHIEELRNMPGGRTLLLHMIKEYGFNSSDAHDMLNSTQTGALFHSHTFRAVLDRERILIRALEQSTITKVIISKMGIHAIKDNLDLLISEVESMETNKDVDLEFFDFEKITFPLVARTWEAGDRFHPIGMKGSEKKVKDFLTDQKVSRLDKQNVLVLESEGEIIWVMGHRMNDRYKVTPGTNRYMKMKMLHSKI